MARPGIGYEDVAQAAIALVESGKHPTIAAVRETMGGTGSPNTIQKFLSAWKDFQRETTALKAPAATLPTRIVDAINAEIERVEHDSTKNIRDQLREAKEETQELAKAGEAIEAERDSLAEIVERITRQRDQWEAVEEELRTDIARLHQVEQIERASRAKAQSEADRALAMLEAEKVKSQGQASEIENLRKELALTVKERGDAFQASAVMQAKLEAAERRAGEAEAREKATATKLEQTEAEIRQERAEVTKSRVHIQSQQIALDTAARELERLDKNAVKPEKAKPASKQVAMK